METSPLRRSLPRVLNAPAIAILASASMGPAYSVAVTMGPMVAATGEAAPLALAVLSLLMVCVAIGFGRMASTHPDAGSSYGWVEAAFGRGLGAYAAWLLLLSNFFATMATALPAGIYTLDLVAPQFADSPLAAAVVGALWIGASALLLAGGLRPTAGASALFLLAEVAVVLASALAVAAHGPFGGRAEAVASSLAGGASSPLASGAGLSGFASAIVLGIWMSDGWEVSASASEETTAAGASGRGGLLGLLVTTAILLATMTAYLRLGQRALVAHQSNVLAAVAGALGGGAWTAALGATVLISTAATLWTTMLYLSRSLFAMGRSGLLPAPLARLDARGNPGTATAVVAAGVGLATLATGFVASLAQALQLVLNATSVFLGLLFALSVAAGVRLAGDRARTAGAVVPAIGGGGLVVVVAIALAATDAVTRGIALGGLALGVPFAWWRSRR